ncbi:alkaline phosphatase family protein [Dactylosporangium sp. NPDC051485]|uniref:alkaline phosphatase family protein n=1 Tax=Dactylosporangium sp. NPDC051485 TaxID=3154846 RepID=UPI00342DF81E
MSTSRQRSVRRAIAGLGGFVLAATALPAFVATAHAAPAKATPTAVTASGVPRPDHVVVVVFENTTASSIYGNSQAPYFNQLANTGAKFTDSAAIEHPSQPNYLDLFSGSNQGVTDDSCPHTFNTANVGAQLIAAGLTFTGYSEDLPSAGSTVCTATGADGGNFARKHAPWVNFTNIPATDNQPFSAFPTDFTQLPTVSWVIPNLCDDMHDCSVATGDTWLKNHLDAYVRWADTHNSILITTFDENDGSSGNQIATFFNGQPVKQGLYPEAINHFSVLRTVEDMYALPYAGSAAGATSITDIWGTTVAGPITSGITGKCADDNHQGTTNGTKIQLWSCNGSIAQQFTLRAGGSLGVMGKCMDVTSSGTANGTKVQLYDCNGTGAQVWKQTANGSLLNPHSGRCLDDPGSSTTDGTQLQIYDCNGTNAQKWSLP